jgi:hypothetical protein
MFKTTIPFFNTVLLYLLKTSLNENLVACACLGRNGEKIGECSDEVIKRKTGLSHDIIQKAICYM